MRSHYLYPLWSFLAFSVLATAGVALASQSISFGNDDGFQYAYIEPGTDGTQVMSGTFSDHLEDIAKDSHDPVLWFERHGEEYVVRAPAYTNRAHEVLQPVMDLGREQGRLGAKQGKLGAKQGSYGARMGALGARLGEIATREAMARMDGRDTDDLSREREEIRREMDDLRREQEPLSQAQRDLGAQQRELGHKQKEASKKAEAELQRILDDAIKAGAASRLAGWPYDDGYWTI
jgi:hypothetical protein